MPPTATRVDETSPSDRGRPRGTTPPPLAGPTRRVHPLAAIGGLTALVVVVLGGWRLLQDDQEPAAPPFARPMEPGDSVLEVEDPRADPAFDEAYATVCGQTLLELDAMYAAAAAGAPDLTATIDAHYQTLTQRIANVYERADLWSATDPLVLEYAETIAADLASILDGTEVGFDYLDGDVALFRSLCSDWFAPT